MCLVKEKLSAYSQFETCAIVLTSIVFVQKKGNVNFIQKNKKMENYFLSHALMSHSHDFSYTVHNVEKYNHTFLYLLNMTKPNTNRDK